MSTNGKYFIIISLLCLLITGVATAQPPYITLTQTPIIIPVATSTYGASFDNITGSGFNILDLPVDALTPYTWVVMGSFTVITFLLLMFTFVAMWWGGGDIRFPSLIGIMFGSLLLFGTGGLGVSLPPEIPGIAYGVIIASVAGLLLGILKTV